MAATIALAAAALVATASAAFPSVDRVDCPVGGHGEVASFIVFGVPHAQLDPLCLAMAVRDGEGWSALANLGEVIWRATLMEPWGEAWDGTSRGTPCAGI